MRGHEDLIRIRSRGAKPAGLVYVDDYPVRPEYTRWLMNDTAPSVCTHGDPVDGLDLRFLIGLNVMVTGDDVTRVRRIASACKKAGAETVFAACGERFAVSVKGEAKWQSS